MMTEQAKNVSSEPQQQPRQAAQQEPLQDPQQSEQNPTLDPHQSTLIVEALTVRTGRLVCDVRVLPSAPFYTTETLANMACAVFPDLPHHACVNSEGQCFGAVINHTSLPHLLEHLTISCQLRNSRNTQASFQGTTEWTCEAQGKARIQVSFTDDLEALRAFNEALEFLNRCCANL